MQFAGSQSWRGRKSQLRGKPSLLVLHVVSPTTLNIDTDRVAKTFSALILKERTHFSKQLSTTFTFFSSDNRLKSSSNWQRHCFLCLLSAFFMEQNFTPFQSTSYTDGFALTFTWWLVFIECKFDWLLSQKGEHCRLMHFDNIVPVKPKALKHFCLSFVPSHHTLSKISRTLRW